MIDNRMIAWYTANEKGHIHIGTAELGRKGPGQARPDQVIQMTQRSRYIGVSWLFLLLARWTGSGNGQAYPIPRFFSINDSVSTVWVFSCYCYCYCCSCSCRGLYIYNTIITITQSQSQL